MNRRTLLGAAVGCVLATFAKVFGKEKGEDELDGMVRGLVGKVKGVICDKTVPMRIWPNNRSGNDDYSVVFVRFYDHGEGCIGMEISIDLKCLLWHVKVSKVRGVMKRYTIIGDVDKLSSSYAKTELDGTPVNA